MFGTSPFYYLNISCLKEIERGNVIYNNVEKIMYKCVLINSIIIQRVKFRVKFSKYSLYYRNVLYTAAWIRPEKCKKNACINCRNNIKFFLFFDTINVASKLKN